MRFLIAVILIGLFAQSASAQVRLVSATLPAARTVAPGEVATVFATVINPSNEVLSNCVVEIDEHYTGRPSVLLGFQRTDASNNLIGEADTAFDLGAGGAQTLVLSVTPQSAFDVTEIGTMVRCTGGETRVISGVNTVSITAEASRADLIPIAVTPTSDGIARIGAAGGATAISVAVTNIGATETVTIRPGFGRYEWPLAVQICETDAGTGFCSSPRSEAVTREIPTGAVHTFTVFVRANARLGTPLLPEIARVFIGFESETGELLADTSVAVISPEGSGYRALDLAAAEALAREQGSRALLIQRNGETLLEYYTAPGGVDVVERLASGTKSFSCLSQALALDRGLFNPDDLAWSGISEWAPDSGEPWAAVLQDIRGRDMIAIAHGLPPGPASLSVATIDSYREVIDATPIYRADRHAVYGRSGFQGFAAMFELRTGGFINSEGLVVGGQDPSLLVEAEVFQRLGMDVTWNRDQNGKPNFSASAAVTARDWARYGRLMLDDGRWEGQRILSPTSLRRCVHYRTEAYAGYGLSFWLNRDVGDTYQDDRDSLPPEVRRHMPTTGRMMPAAPPDHYAAWGAGNMQMHMIPSEDLVIVKFGGEGDPNLFFEALFGTE